jgi:hypothetical protein
MKTQVYSSSRGWKRFLFVVKRREEKGCMWACRETQKPVVLWIRLEIGFL